MSSTTEAMTVASAVRDASAQRFFNICYLTAISVATFGWLSGFGWIAVRVATWLWS